MPSKKVLAVDKFAALDPLKILAERSGNPRV
jgi:hypothetical protein